MHCSLRSGCVGVCCLTAVRHYFYLLYYSDSLSKLPFHHATSIQLEGEGNVCSVLAEASVW